MVRSVLFLSFLEELYYHPCHGHDGCLVASLGDSEKIPGNLVYRHWFGAFFVKHPVCKNIYQGRAPERMNPMLRSVMKRLSIILLVFWGSVSIVFGLETIRVGAYQNPPKVFMTPDGRVTGIFPEVLQEIAEKSGWEIKYVSGTWQQCLNALENGTIDLMVDMAGIRRTRKTLCLFKRIRSRQLGEQLSPGRISPFESFLDMEGLTVAVMRESIHTEGSKGIKSLMTQFGVSCRYMEFDDYQQVLMIVDEKKSDVGIVNRLYGTLHSDEYEVRSTPIVFNPRVLAFSVRKDDARDGGCFKRSTIG